MTALFGLLALQWSSPVRAQDDFVEQHDQRGRWGSVYIMAGPSTLERMDLFLQDYQLLAPGSALLQTDLGDHTLRRRYGLDGVVSRAFSAAVGFHPFLQGDRRGPELRLGVQYSGGNVGGLAYERNLSFPFDTLSSPNTGQTFLVDSVTQSRYSMEHGAERVGVDASLIFRSGGRSRWSFHGGVGLGVGVVVNARTQVSHQFSTSVNYPGTSWYSGDIDLEEVEDYRNGNSAWFAAGAQFGLGFQLARQGDFLRRMDLFYEFRPQMIITAGDDLGGTTRFGNQWLFGLRVRLDR
jgi:hypothetical protein